ncbi:hypothetical protein MKW94_006452 [Papaver nudicaule]|uniref:MADS-box domain-containing protein n=1 Tax=Papaver nudicaule TaxID=74823 RepID=A0AA41V3S4_PAPNU|nr:hypothetical protein [Papaver nudicaule]
MGKRRIEIAEIQDRAKKNVTFCKRRKGLFKKASELSSLCDAKVALIVFSSAGTLYTHGEVGTLIPYQPSSEPGEEEKIENSRGGFWWDKINLDEYDTVEKLEDLKNSLLDVRKALADLKMEKSSSASTATSSSTQVNETEINNDSLEGNNLGLSDDEIEDILGNYYSELASTATTHSELRMEL